MKKEDKMSGKTRIIKSTYTKDNKPVGIFSEDWNIWCDYNAGIFTKEISEIYSLPINKIYRTLGNVVKKLSLYKHFNK
jgi:hypothetical protein